MIRLHNNYYYEDVGLVQSNNFIDITVFLLTYFLVEITAQW